MIRKSSAHALLTATCLVAYSPLPCVPTRANVAGRNGRISLLSCRITLPLGQGWKIGSGALDRARRPAQGDSFKTLFVGRISYEATEKKLRREFEEYGPVKRVRLVQEKDTGAHPDIVHLSLICLLTMMLSPA